MPVVQLRHSVSADAGSDKGDGYIVEVQKLSKSQARAHTGTARNLLVPASSPASIF